MLNKNRLLPFFHNNKLFGFVSFYIGNENDNNKFIRENMWSILEDNANGSICWIDQLWGTQNHNYSKYSFEIWKMLKDFLKLNFPSVSIIHWNRWKNNKRYTFIKKI